MTYRIAGDDGRYYDTPDGLYPSVTSILGVIDKPFLRNWVARSEREKAVTIAGQLYSDTLDGQRMSPTGFRMALKERMGKAAGEERMAAAADIGSEIHAMIEAHLRGEAVPAATSPQAVNAFNAFVAWSQHVNLKPLFIEHVVWSPQYQYAGAADLIGWLDIPGIGNGLAVLDWKSGNGIYESAYLQNAAYAHALVERAEAQPPVHGVIVRLPKSATASPEIRVIPADYQRDIFDIFKETLDVWRGQRRLKSVLTELSK